MSRNDTPQHYHQRWENSNSHRYYEVRIERDLFGWVMTRIWGRKGTKLGRIVNQPCDSFEDACQQISSIEELRQRRGYCRIETKGIEP